MNNKEFGKLFNTLCESVNKPDSQIADKLGVDRATIGRWRKGERTPNLSLLPQIAKYFDISLDIFTMDSFDNIESYRENKSISSVTNIKTTTHTVPIYGHLSAGVSLEAIREIRGEVTVPDKIAKKKKLFGLKIFDDSMNRVIPDGAIGVFQRSDKAKPKEVAAVIVGSDNAIIRHLHVLQNGYMLEPDSYSDEHMPRIIKNSDGIEVRVIGKLVWYCVDIAD